MSAKSLILLRTHFVDARVAALARSYAAGGDYDVMIAVDETVGDIDTAGLPKLSMTLDSCARLGLNVEHEQPLWRCGDYLFYHAHARHPHYERYWSIEYDIVLNSADPLDFLRYFDREAREDYLTTFLEIAPERWEWRRAAARRFPVVYSSGFALVRLSVPAIVRLLERRRFEAARLKREKLKPARQWLNDEAFVSSAAPELGLGMADFNAYGDFYSKATLMRSGVFHPDELPPPDGKVYHAVRTGASYLAATRSYYDFDLSAFFRFADRNDPAFAESAVRLIAGRLADAPDDPSAVFGESGPLANAVGYFSEPQIAAVLMRALAQARLRLCIEALQFARVVFPVARTPAHDNLALGRPAWQSSTSPRSRKRKLARDAEGGNDGDTSAEYGFHTRYQLSPWWAVDLGATHALSAVRLYNRPQAEHRLKTFVIETSPDFVEWTTAFAHDPADMRLLKARPIEIVFERPLSARYLRVRLARTGVLHLAEIEAIRA